MLLALIATLQAITTTATVSASPQQLTGSYYQREEGCLFSGRSFSDAQTWIHQSFFNVTCRRGGVRVLNCITPRGSILPLGTENFEEAGYNYSCRVRSRQLLAASTPYPTWATQISFTEPGEGEEGAGSEVAGGEDADYADECLQGQSDYVREGFMVSCVTHRLLGCVDYRGNLIRTGIYLQSLSKGTLRECRLLDEGRRARADAWGCFTGSTNDDPDEARLRVAMGEVWRSGDLELRCDEVEGWKVNRCFTATAAGDGDGGGSGGDESYELTGSAWIDDDNVFNICK